jgi:[CysO sulfur-carrier protein]-S-L-cysteine hydrolase
MVKGHSVLPTELSQLVTHVESTYPREGCGLILEERGGALRVRPMENAYDRYHEIDPQRFPRSSYSAYYFDSKEWLKVLREVDERNYRIAYIFHSHCDLGAYFSDEDRAMAAPNGEPLMPGVGYLVLAVDGGRMTALKLFDWKEGEYREVELPFRR